MLLLGRFALNEEVGIRRILACAVGFVGTLLVVQPSFNSVGWPALYCACRFTILVAYVFAAWRVGRVFSNAGHFQRFGIHAEDMDRCVKDADRSRGRYQIEIGARDTLVIHVDRVERPACQRFGGIF